MAEREPEAALVSLSDACHRLGVKYRRGFDLFLSGRLHGIRRGRRILVSTDSVDLYLERQRRCAVVES